MNSLVLIFAVVVGVGIGAAVFYFLSKKNEKGEEKESQAFLMLQNQLNEQCRVLI